MQRLFPFILSLLSFTVTQTQAQEVWSLEKCIEYAQKNSIVVKQAEAGVRDSELLLNLDKSQRLPSINGSVRGGMQFGRTIDPTTNQFRTENTTFNTFSLNANAVVFNGNRINNSIEQSKINLETSRLDAEATQYDLALQIATAYLNILLAEEQLENARNQQQLSQQQLEQTDKLIRAGTLPSNERLNIVAQIAGDQQAIIQAENAVAVNYLNLRQLLELDPAINMTIQRPDIEIPTDADSDLYTEREVYATALGILPSVRAGDLRVESANLGVDIARSGVFPTLSVGGSLSTNFSDRGLRIDGFQDIINFTDVIIENQTVEVGFPGQQPLTSPNPYFAQLGDNFGQSLGVTLQVPIFNQNQNRINIERARLNVINAELQNRQTRQQVQTDVQNAVTNAKAAKRSYQAAQLSVDAAEAAYNNAQKSYDLGAINTLEFTTARNTLDQARVELIRAKYQYFFNLKVVDFYLGKPLKLN
jgi:outer membrane protein